jgi:hypothetical protein
METKIFLIAFALLNVFLLLLTYKLLIKSRGWPYIGVSLGSMITMWVLGEAANKVKIYLNHKGVIIHVGHSSIALVVIWLSFAFILVILIFLILLLRGIRK